MRISSTLSGHVGKVLTTHTPISMRVRSTQLARFFVYDQLIRFERHIYNGIRHSARLSRLLTAGTKSLLSLIAGDGVGRSAASSALEPSKQGSDVQDLGVSFVNQVQNMQQQQLQTNAGPYEGVTAPSSCHSHSHNYLHFIWAVLRSKIQSLDFDPPQTNPPSAARLHMSVAVSSTPCFVVATSRKP